MIEIEIYPCGQLIEIIGHREAVAIITGVFIRKGLIQYEVQCNNKGEMECILLIEEQFKVEDAVKVKIGFK